MKSKPKILILAGLGLNCEEETKFVFDTVGGEATIVHLNDFIEKPSILKNFQILAVPGGFSFGDDMGSGKAYAGKLMNHASQEIHEFLKRDTLMIGICNGFQILTQAGILPGGLSFNSGGRYLDRWVDLKVVGKSPWTKGIKTLSLPIAHGEGRYIKAKNTEVSLKYTKGSMCEYQNLSANPNGAEDNIAGVMSYEGRVLGLMPHPERGFFFTQRPDFTLEKEKLVRAGKKLPTYSDGYQIFKNGVDYFK